MPLIGNISRYILAAMLQKSGDADQRKNAVMEDAKAFIIANFPAFANIWTIDGKMYKYFENVGRYATRIFSDDPVGYWRFAEPSGTAAIDQTENTNDGLYVNTPTLGVASPVSATDKAVTFTAASSEYCTIFFQAAYNAVRNGDFTIEMWINAPDAGGGSTYLGSYGTGTAILMELIGIGTGGVTNEYAFDQFDGVADVQAVSFGSFPINTWVHLVLTRTATVMTAYANGVIATPGILAGATAPAVVNIQEAVLNDAITVGAATATGPYSNGTIDELAFYTRALSAAEVAAHYAARQP